MVKIIPKMLSSDQDVTQWAYECMELHELRTVEHKGTMWMVYKDTPKTIRVFEGMTMFYKEEG